MLLRTSFLNSRSNKQTEKYLYTPFRPLLPLAGSRTRPKKVKPHWVGRGSSVTEASQHHREILGWAAVNLGPLSPSKSTAQIPPELPRYGHCNLLGGLRGIFLPYAPPLVAFNISPFAISNLPQSVYTGSTMVLCFLVSFRLGSVYSTSSIWLWRLHPILGVARRDETWSGLQGPFSTGQLQFKD